MKFRPLHARVVVRRVEEDTKTKGGIIIPDTAKEKPMQGEVIAVGPGGRDESGTLGPIDVKHGARVVGGGSAVCPGVRDESGKLVPIDVKTGDRVRFGKWSGTEVVLDGEDLLIMK